MQLQLVPVPVTDVERAKAFYAERELVDRGVEVSEVRREPWGSRHAYFADPDGNTWQLQQPR